MNDAQQDIDPDDGLNALRSLLLKPEKEQIEQLQTRIENEDLRAEDVSKVLAEAFLIRLGRDDKLSRALTPTIESALEASTKRNTRVLVDAISPLMGPAIRKSILQTIGGMIQSMNETLDQSFSAQGLKWRWEAFRTGKSFGEVVLLHTLVYQVEQVFLIHKETGLLLQHVTRQATESMDGDMVSGMLTAIQDFVQDSFGGHPDEALHTMQVGDLTVWIEQGPQAVLAGVLRGNPPSDLHTIFQESLENIHLEQKKAFEEFEGDAVYFEGSRRHLEECLRSQYRAEVATRKKKISPLTWLVLIGLLAGLGFWAYVGIQARQRWDGYVTRLDEAPGIVVIEKGYRDGAYFVSGLRDPLAVDPTSFLADWSLSSESVRGKWAPYQSFEPQLAQKRAQAVLRPPDGVSLSIQDGVLIAEGEANHRWIEDAKTIVRVLPGIQRFEHANLIDVDLREVEHIQTQIHQIKVLFVLGEDAFADGQVSQLEKLVGLIAELDQISSRLGFEYVVEVFGDTDPSGAEDLNQILRQKRAQRVVAYLANRGISTATLSVGVGLSELSNERSVTDVNPEFKRRVTFRVVVQKGEIDAL